MAALSIAITLAIRIVMVLLFFPCSAIDKIIDFRGAIRQARARKNVETFDSASTWAKKVRSP